MISASELMKKIMENEGCGRYGYGKRFHDSIFMLLNDCKELCGTEVLGPDANLMISEECWAYSNGGYPGFSSIGAHFYTLASIAMAGYMAGKESNNA